MRGGVEPTNPFNPAISGERCLPLGYNLLLQFIFFCIYKVNNHFVKNYKCKKVITIRNRVFTELIKLAHA